MRLDRRRMLKGTALAGAGLSLPLASAAVQARARLAIYDSRIPESRAFASSAGIARTIDLSDEHASRFAALRGPLPEGAEVEGLTGWSDWVALRGELEARGLRVAAEEPVHAPLSHQAHLFRWSMRPR